MAIKHIELNNYISYTKSEEINSICQPLFSSTPITVVEYSRVYPDGSRVQLSSDESKIKNSIISSKNIKKHLYTPALIPKNQRYILMDSWVKNIETSASDILQNRLDTQRKMHGIDNEFRIIISHPKFSEMFHFYTDKNVRDRENFYLNNTHILEQFIIYFLNNQNFIYN